MPPTIEVFKGNVFAQIIFRFPCAQKILMVTDGSLSFGTGGFGLSEFVGIITGAGHAVTTAHRSAGFDFSTASPAVTTANYDQVWLFGFVTTALSTAEQSTIAQFMQKGGGIFATGDHETIGAGMGASIPRVRRMRNWSTIPMSNPNRHDTVVNPGVDQIKQFDDQADPFPQPIYPVFFSNGGPDNSPSTWSVHPVLRHSSGAVDFLPDHAHESECLAPAPGAGSFAGVEEWPAPIGGGGRIAPQVVAVSISAGRFITAHINKPPVRPRCFGAISAYDGNAAAVGRIVCDATWHHFVNINLNGAGGVPDTTGAPRTGLYVAGSPTPEYQKIKTYYLNTVRWLAPIGRRFCWPWIIATLIRFDFEMLELQLPKPHPCPWDPLIEIGLVAEEALARYFGPGALADVVEDVLAAADASPAMRGLLKAQQYTADEPDRRREASLLPLQDMRRVIFGSLVNVVAHQFPEDEKQLASMLKKGHDDLAP
ncbi:MAG TPA: hypothetical protein VM779_04760, partial [Thermoanaerobaculia bacterium]|nr:hypothetical protein [Thermoanaerobaculia bacterium]